MVPAIPLARLADVAPTLIPLLAEMLVATTALSELVPVAPRLVNSPDELLTVLATTVLMFPIDALRLASVPKLVMFGCAAVESVPRMVVKLTVLPLRFGR